MGVPSGAIDSDFQKILLDVKIDGAPARDATGVTVSMGLTQVNATATIEGVTRPNSAEEGQSVEISAGYETPDGSGRDTIFVGEVSGLTWRYFPGSVPIQCRDKFARLRNAWGGEDREYNSQDDAAIIRNLLEAMGIPSSDANIESSEWTLGTVEPVVARSGQPFFSLIERIDRLAGYRTFTDKNGKILRRRISGDVGVGTVWEYERGENIISCERSRTTQGIVNRAVVSGLNYLGLQVGGAGVAEASAANPFVPTPPQFITEEVQDDLIESDDDAIRIAVRTVADKNRRPETYRLVVPFNPRLQPGLAVKITHPTLETSSGSRFLIDQVNHSIQTSPPLAQTTFTTLGGQIVAGEVNIPPIATFTVEFFKEAEDTGSGVEQRIILIADGSGSSDPDGDALGYSWVIAATGGTATPTTGTGARLVSVLTGAVTSVDVTLTVTDADAATNVLGPQSYPINTGTMATEPLYLAWDGMIEASTDGEMTWNSFTGVASGPTCTAPFAAEWGTIWGDSAGVVWMTIDDLLTDAVSTGAPAGAVACGAVWINELDTTRVWAGFANGKIYSGVADTTTPAITWTLAGTVPASPVVELREAVGANGSLRVTAGAGYYASEDGGNSWNLLHTFDVARRMAAGFSTNLASGLNSTPPLFAESGTLPTVPGGTTHIRGLTFGWRTPALYATDDGAKLFTTDDTFAALTEHTDVLPARGNHMIRSGNFDGPVIYTAVGDGTGDNGPTKWIPDVAAPWFLRIIQDTECHMIGYAPARMPAAQVDFFFATYGVLDANGGGVWRYTAGLGYTKMTTPPGCDGWVWLHAIVHPTNPLRWYLLGGQSSDINDGGVDVEESGDTFVGQDSGLSPIWTSADAGATWAAVAVGQYDEVEGRIFAIACQDQSGDLWAVGQAPINGGSVFWRGQGASIAFFDKNLDTLPPGTWLNAKWIQSGSNGDLVTSEDDSVGSGTSGRLGYIMANGIAWSPTDTWATDAGRGWSQPFGPIDVTKDGREFWQVSLQPGIEGIVHASDYRVTDPLSNVPSAPAPLSRAVDVAGDYTYVAVGLANVFFASREGTDIGFYRSQDLGSWTPTGTPSHPMFQVYQCVTDRQSRKVFIGYAEASDNVYVFSAFDGRVWSDIQMPDPALNGAGSPLNTGNVPAFAAIGVVGVPI